jgi:hypothetical protein
MPDRYTVTTYNRTAAFFPGSGTVHITRENEREEYTGTAAEVADYLADTIRENYADEIDAMESDAAYEADDPVALHEVERMRDDMADAEEFAREAVRYAAEGESPLLISGLNDPEIIPLDPEPSRYAEVRREGAQV